jgi:hypothetical protein
LISTYSWSTASTAAVGYNSRAKKEVNFFEKIWTFRDPGKGKTETLMPDNYEYPFNIVLDGGLPESIEGLPESWIVYRFKADIGRKYSKDVQIRKPLRIIRTLGPSALETAHEMVRYHRRSSGYGSAKSDRHSLWRTSGPIRLSIPSVRLPRLWSLAPPYKSTSVLSHF